MSYNENSEELGRLRLGLLNRARMIVLKVLANGINFKNEGSNQ